MGNKGPFPQMSLTDAESMGFFAREGRAVPQHGGGGLTSRTGAGLRVHVERRCRWRG